MEQGREVVLTYRPEQSAEPVVLRYERELPCRMRREREEQSRRELSRALARAAGTERKRKAPRRGVRAAVGVALLAALVCLGVGIWYVQSFVLDRPGGGDAGSQPPDGDYYYYYWEDQEREPQETTIHTYRPYGGSGARLELVSAGEDAQALTPGEVYDRVRPSTVTVLGEDAEGYSVGTGVIFTEDGYILTNYHVIDGCSACQVWITDEYGVDSVYDALLVGGDADQDLAVLKIDAQGLTPAEFGVSDELSVGDPVYAIGNPLGLDLRSTFTDGIVSAVNRDVDVDGVIMTLIQTNAALNSGNSGGPLINQYGQVVGINTIKMMSGYDTLEGLGFAIPTSLAQRWVNELIEYGELQPQPLLGLTISRIPEVLDGELTGLRVEEVSPGLGGEAAGVEVGDYILSFNGQEITRIEQILSIRQTLSVGDMVEIQVWRDGEILTLTMEMMAGE